MFEVLRYMPDEGKVDQLPKHIKTALDREDKRVSDAQKNIKGLASGSQTSTDIHDKREQLADEVNDKARLADQIRSEFDIPQAYPPTHAPAEANNVNDLPTNVVNSIDQLEDEAVGYMEHAAHVNKHSAPAVKSKKTKKDIQGMRQATRLADQIRSEFGLPKRHPIRKPFTSGK